MNRLLVVEDEATIAACRKKDLSESGYVADLVLSGQGAVQYGGVPECDMVLLGVMLHGVVSAGPPL